MTRVNGLRAPDYFRLDFRVDRTFTVHNKPLLVYGGFQNVTNRKNYASINWDRGANKPYEAKQQGLFPTFGMDWRF
jgi:hypothetical protein